jgi:ABC-2 type transport system ATP-binding protein
VQIALDSPPLRVDGADEIGVIAAERQIVLYELTPHHASLEQAYMDLTRDFWNTSTSPIRPWPKWPE